MPISMNRNTIVKSYTRKNGRRKISETGKESKSSAPRSRLFAQARNDPYPTSKNITSKNSTVSTRPSRRKKKPGSSNSPQRKPPTRPRRKKHGRKRW
jgi:hypothetical protein